MIVDDPSRHCALHLTALPSSGHGAPIEGGFSKLRRPSSPHHRFCKPDPDGRGRGGTNNPVTSRPADADARLLAVSFLAVIGGVWPSKHLPRPPLLCFCSRDVPTALLLLDAGVWGCLLGSGGRLSSQASLLYLIGHQRVESQETQVTQDSTHFASNVVQLSRQPSSRHRSSSPATAAPSSLEGLPAGCSLVGGGGSIFFAPAAFDLLSLTLPALRLPRLCLLVDRALWARRRTGRRRKGGDAGRKGGS